MDDTTTPAGPVERQPDDTARPSIDERRVAFRNRHAPAAPPTTNHPIDEQRIAYRNRHGLGGAA
ncbi:hypothetical protein [Streptomyces aidingensis]|uniref:Uncharacterized protein n=1 Tax=Streptomyces aidingensis TaxID=910347 RepID=A0A1I1TT91_9ACTN|nr:hypothetical protein [Streptomyces aidingensis]SFD61827.1 hypothetical protein SAMN05421773_12123 [Streptomyces aidingensis]